MNYARNPEKLKAAEARLVAIEKIVAENDARLKAAQQAQAVAAKTLAERPGGEARYRGRPRRQGGRRQGGGRGGCRRRNKDAAFLLTFRQELARLRKQSKASDLKISTAHGSRNVENHSRTV